MGATNFDICVCQGELGALGTLQLPGMLSQAGWRVLVLPGQGRVSLSPAWGEGRTRPGRAEGEFQATSPGTMSVPKEITMPWHRHQELGLLWEAELKGTFWRPLVKPRCQGGLCHPAQSQAACRVWHQGHEAPSSPVIPPKPQIIPCKSFPLHPREGRSVPACASMPAPASPSCYYRKFT